MDGDSVTRMGLTLGLLLGIPGLLLVALRRFGVRLPGQPSSAARLAVVSRLALDAKHSLVLFRRDGHEQLILIGPSEVKVLDANVSLSEAEHTTRENECRAREAQVTASRAAVQQLLQRLRLARAGGGEPAERTSFSNLVEEIRPPSLRRHCDRAA